MNNNAMLYYADLIENNELGVKFDMSDWLSPSKSLNDLLVNLADDSYLPLELIEDEHRCGTAACIAGHICVIAADGFPADSFTNFMAEAAGALSLNRAEATVLFKPWVAGLIWPHEDAEEVSEFEKDARSRIGGDYGQWAPDYEKLGVTRPVVVTDDSEAYAKLTRSIAVGAMRKAAEAGTLINCWPEEFGVDYSALQWIKDRGLPLE